MGINTSDEGEEGRLKIADKKELEAKEGDAPNKQAVKVKCLKVLK